MDTDNIEFGFAGSPLCLLRSDVGDGGWSLHTTDQIADSDASGEPPEVLLSGPAQWDEASEDWSRPNTEDVAAAMAKIDR